MQEVKIKAIRREKLGTKAAKKYRQSGWIPVVVYQKGEAAQHYCVDRHDIVNTLNSKGTSFILTLQINGNGEMKRTLIREYQYDPITHELLHVDLQELKEGEYVKVKLPVVLEGTPPGVVKGGILQQQLREITVRCLPDKLMDKVIVDVSKLELGESIRVKELNLGEGIEIEEEPETLVATVVERVGVESEEASAEATSQETESST